MNRTSATSGTRITSVSAARRRRLGRGERGARCLALLWSPAPRSRRRPGPPPRPERSRQLAHSKQVVAQPEHQVQVAARGGSAGPSASSSRLNVAAEVAVEAYDGAEVKLAGRAARRAHRARRARRGERPGREGPGQGRRVRDGGLRDRRAVDARRRTSSPAARRSCSRGSAPSMRSRAPSTPRCSSSTPPDLPGRRQPADAKQSQAAGRQRRGRGRRPGPAGGGRRRCASQTALLASLQQRQQALTALLAGARSTRARLRARAPRGDRPRPGPGDRPPRAGAAGRRSTGQPRTPARRPAAPSPARFRRRRRPRRCRSAEAQIGKPYVWAAAGPNSYDCSGLVMWSYAQVGVQLDHWTGDQWNEGAHVSRAQLRPGDLVFFAYNTSDPRPSIMWGCTSATARWSTRRTRAPTSATTQPSAPTTSARCVPTSGERDRRTPGRRHLRRPQQRARDLLRHRRQRARRARPRAVRRRPDRHHDRGSLGARRRARRWRCGAASCRGRGAGTSVVLPGDPTALPAELAGVDVVFPLLHGPYGEDGTVQGLLELAGIPYVGSGVFASAAAMDKHHMKRLLREAGTGGAAVRRGARGSAGPGRRRATSGCRSSSSRRGRAPASASPRSTPAEDLEAALAAAHGHDPKALVEAAVVGREIECGVLAGLDGGPPEASLPAEIRVAAGAEFYDFEAKYMPESRHRVRHPAGPARRRDRRGSSRSALAAFEALDCEGLARVDFFLAADGRVLVNEVNTMPGFTPVSMFPQMWAATGVDYATPRRAADRRRASAGAPGCAEPVAGSTRRRPGLSGPARSTRNAPWPWYDVGTVSST